MDRKANAYSKSVELLSRLEGCPSEKVLLEELRKLRGFIRNDIPSNFFPQLFITDNGFAAIKKAVTKLNFQSLLSLDIFECCLQILGIATSYTILRSWLLSRKHIEAWIELAIRRMFYSFCAIQDDSNICIYAIGTSSKTDSSIQAASPNEDLKSEGAQEIDSQSETVSISSDVDYDEDRKDLKKAKICSAYYLKTRLLLAVLSFAQNDSTFSLLKLVPSLQDNTNASLVELSRVVEAAIQKLSIKPLAFPNVLPQVLLLCPSISIFNLILLHLRALIRSSPENAIKIGYSKTMHFLLTYLFEPPTSFPLSDVSKDLLNEITLQCATFGVSNASAAKVLRTYLKTKSEFLRTWLLKALSHLVAPSFYFNPSTKGYSSIDFTLSSPVMPINGYSVSLWLNIESLMNDDGNYAPITLFLISDFLKSTLFRLLLDASKKTVVVHIGSSKDTCVVNFSTPITNFFSKIYKDNPSLNPPSWHLITLVHRNEKSSLPNLELYIDGSAVERAACPYPFLSSTLQPLYVSLGPSIGSRNQSTPSTLAPNVAETDALVSENTGAASQKTSKSYKTNDSLKKMPPLVPLLIGTTRFFPVPLVSSQIAIISSLGPSYSGCFQGPINDYMTYKASTALTLEIQDSKSNTEDLLHSIQAFSRSPIAFMSCAKDYVDIMDLQLSDFCSFSVLETLKKLENQYYSHVYINRAVSSYDKAFSAEQPSFGVSSGSVTPIIMQSISDAIYNIGGSSILLELVGTAETEAELNFGLQVFFSSIEDNWRFSENVEQTHSFEILAQILHSKSHLLVSEETLKIIALMSGVHHTRFKHPLVMNPLLFRYLILDFDLWSKAPNSNLFVQQLGYIVSLIENNDYAGFNVKRLMKMQILKKLLTAMRNCLFHKDLLPILRLLFKVLMTSAFVSENIRSVATYIIYASQATGKSKPIRRSSVSIAVDRSDSNYISIKESGYAICEEFIDLLIKSNGEPSFLRRFSSMITPAWLLFLLRQQDSHYFICGIRLLNQSICSLGSSFLSKFSQKFHGFLILHDNLKDHIHLEELWLNLLFLSLGLGIRSVQFRTDLTYKQKLDFVLKNELDNILPLSEVFPSLFHAIQATLEKVSTVNGKLNSENVAALRYADDTMSFLVTLQTTYSFELTLNYDFSELLTKVVFPFLSPVDTITAEQEMRDLLHNIRQPLPRSSSSKTFGEGIKKSVRKFSMSGSFKRVVTPLGTQLRKDILNDSITDMENTSSFTASFPQSDQALQYFDNFTVQYAEAKDVIKGLLFSILTCIYNRITSGQGFSYSRLLVYLPPSQIEKKSTFFSGILRSTMSRLIEAVKNDKLLLAEPSILANISYIFTKFIRMHLLGYLKGSWLEIVDDLGSLLEEIISRPDFLAKLPKNGRNAAMNMYSCFLDLFLLEVSDLKQTECNAQSDKIIKSITYWQSLLFNSKTYQKDLFSLLWYAVYIMVETTTGVVRLQAVDAWRLLFLHSPGYLSDIAKTCNNDPRFAYEICKILDNDSDKFVRWLDDNAAEVNQFMLSCFFCRWEDFLKQQHKLADEEASLLQFSRLEHLRKQLAQNTFNENILNESSASYHVWISSLFALECNRFKKMSQDQSDQENFVAAALLSQKNELSHENSILGSKTTSWELDSTEGSERMRKRLMPCLLQSSELDSKLEARSSGARRNRSFDTSVEAPVSLTNEEKQAATLILPSQEETLHDAARSDSNNSMEDEEDDVDEEDKEDKNRTVMRSIESGDSIQDVYNVSRIFGLEATEGILLLGKQYLYLMDNFFLRSDNEIVDVNDNSIIDERDPYLQLLHLQSLSSSGKVRRHISKENNWHWDFIDLSLVLKRFYLLRDVGLELFFKDGRSFLTILSNTKNRDSLYQKLVARAPGADVLSTSHFATSMSRDLGKANGKSNFLSSKLANALSFSTTHPATKRWERREISNFNYLQIVNTLAGRTYNDLTQYPVFPWVIADYTSKELDLNNPKTYRNFCKPMGAQHPERESQFNERYDLLLGLNDSQQQPFHYGTHYSSAMIVCSYLIRLRPFVDSYLALQGGQFDHADRLFYSIEQAWRSSSKENMADVRELIPEFFYLSEMFINGNGFDFGSRQKESTPINDVILPPWAKGDPAIFVQKNREALESKYVSAHLHEWIDLVFGCKQRGDEAVAATNVFHHLSYQGAIDLENIENEFELAAAVGIIHNFGQTPKQVFKKPHPQRGPDFTDTPLGPYLFGRFEDSIHLLFQSCSPIIRICKKVAHIQYDPSKDEVGAFAADYTPLGPNTFLAWGRVDNTVQLISDQLDKQPVMFEELHSEKITHVVACDERTFLTASLDLTLRLWTLSTNKPIKASLKRVLYGHRYRITCVTVCKAFSIIVSGDAGGNLIIWDLNRAEFVSSLSVYKLPIQTIAVNARNAEIAFSTGFYCCVVNVNGKILVKDKLSRIYNENSDENILCSCFYTGANSEWLHKNLFITGHPDGIIRIWEKRLQSNAKLEAEKNNADRPKWRFHLLRQLQHTKGLGRNRVATRQNIITITPNGQARGIFAGDDKGQVFSWMLPDTTSNVHLEKDNTSELCSLCDSRFSLMEWRSQCRACGNSNVCSDCVSMLKDTNIKTCYECYRQMPLCYKN